MISISLGGNFMSERVLSLQDALCQNYNTDSQFVAEEQIGSVAYAEWNSIISELYEITLNEYIKKKSPEYVTDEENTPIFNIIKKINLLVGDVNGIPLYFGSDIGSLIVTFCSPKQNENKYPIKELFRLRVEKFLGRQIQAQKLKTQKIIDDEMNERTFKRDTNAYLRKQRKKHGKETLTQEKDNSKAQKDFTKMPDSPMCDLSSVLYIYKGQIQCKREKHEIISATAKLFDKRDSEIVLNVEYCNRCKKYLLEYSVYEEYRKRYGVIIGNLKMDSSGEVTGEYDLAAESPLRLTGYSVGQKEGYTSKERQYILAQIIHNHIMTKQEVIKYLSYFIKMNGARLGNEYAVSKWQEDMQFVQNYNINFQPSTIIKEIKKY